jgi:2-dehydropantoate 2-reductase
MGSVAVLGPGGVGGLIAAALARAGERVVVVAREPTAELISARGIRVRSAAFGDFEARLCAEPLLTEPVEALIVATKSSGLGAALERIQGECALVVPLLNGLDHMALLRQRFGADRVAAGTIRVESDRPEPGLVVQTSRSVRVDLAADRPAACERLPALAERLQRAGIPTRLERSEAQALWSKLVRLCALALTTSASGQTIGFIRSDASWRRKLERCVAEAVAVGRAEGAQLSAALTLGELDDADPTLGSSMQRDIVAGREPELDAIAGAVLRAGARHGIECPTIAALTGLLAARTQVTVSDHCPQPRLW